MGMVMKNEAASLKKSEPKKQKQKQNLKEERQKRIVENQNVTISVNIF